MGKRKHDVQETESLMSEVLWKTNCDGGRAKKGFKYSTPCLSPALAVRLRVLTPVQSLQVLQNVHMSISRWKTQRCREKENWQKAEEGARCPVYRNSDA